MLSEQEITRRLEAVGFKPREMKKVLSDVAQVILARSLHTCLDTLPPEERTKLQSLSPEDLKTYLADPATPKPNFTQAEFDRIYDDTWEEYFRAVV